MTIDKVRAALEHAKSCARNEYSMHVYKEALSELSGMVLVPVEPTEEMCLAGSGFSRPSGPLNGEAKTWYEAGLSVAREYYAAMIAPYVSKNP